MITPRQRLGVLLGAVLVWLGLVAGSGAIVAASATRPSLQIVCSSIEDLCEQWARTFTSRTGIRVGMVRMSSGEALARISRGGGEFDVWHGGPSDLYEVAQQRQLLQPHHPRGADVIPAAFRSEDGSWTGVYRGILGLCVNQRLLGRLGVPIPRRWDDLLDPRLHGMVSTPDPQTSGTGWTMVWTQRQRLGSDQAALDWMVELHPQVLRYTTSGIAPVGLVSRGEAAVAITFTQHCIKAHDAGATDLLSIVPEGLTGQEVGAVAVLRHSHRGPEARAYVDFATSREAQEMGSETFSQQLPTREDATRDPRLDLPSASWLAPVEISGARHRAELTTRLTRRLGR